MKDQPLQHKLPLEPTCRQKARRGFVGWNRNLFGPLPWEETLLREFSSNSRVGGELSVQKEGEFGS
jgi:hypothetical protein